MLDSPRGHHVVFLGGPGVSDEEYAPPPELTPWVAVGWRIRTSVPFELRILPDGCMDLIGDDVIGSFSQAGIAHLDAGSDSHGIRFHPGGFPALFGVPASELVDLRVPVADVVPASARSGGWPRRRAAPIPWCVPRRRRRT